MQEDDRSTLANVTDHRKSHVLHLRPAHVRQVGDVIQAQNRSARGATCLCLIFVHSCQKLRKLNNTSHYDTHTECTTRKLQNKALRPHLKHCNTQTLKRCASNPQVDQSVLINCRASDVPIGLRPQKENAFTLKCVAFTQNARRQGF